MKRMNGAEGKFGVDQVGCSLEMVTHLWMENDKLLELVDDCGGGEDGNGNGSN